ncbi:nuclease-related domain-containing protein [Streptomyces diastatochromogenes]|uniref:nuclease-related domain-containing protein n=1 Tax=Streptomyces diastatochromogenes TaxID=42236 RepID=UPI001FC979F1|nr:nuclease-related domain-containing protein [Streptomyces diastatochromogenes]MCZ0989133.1 nuclease-related domain-containing protein [Streptomyces diastatochromogenes]
MGAELDRLRPQGWRVLHSVPLPREVDLDHLLIGPGGLLQVWVTGSITRPGGPVWS